MAFVAYIVAVDASGLAHFLLMADFTFHQHVLVQIFERRFADEAFFFLKTYLSYIDTILLELSKNLPEDRRSIGPRPV